MQNNVVSGRWAIRSATNALRILYSRVPGAGENENVGHVVGEALKKHQRV